MELADSLPRSQHHTTVFPTLNSHPSNFFLYESRPVYLWVHQMISFLQIIHHSPHPFLLPITPFTNSILLSSKNYKAPNPAVLSILRARPPYVHIRTPEPYPQTASACDINLLQ